MEWRPAGFSVRSFVRFTDCLGRRIPHQSTTCATGALVAGYDRYACWLPRGGHAGYFSALFSSR